MIKFLSKVKKLIHTKRDAEEKAIREKNSKVAKNNDELDNYSLFSEEQEEDLPSSEEDEDEQSNEEFSLFPKPIVVDNTLSVNSTAVPCSYNENNQTTHHTQPTANFMNGYSTQFNNNFMSTDNNNPPSTNNLLLSSIVSPNTHNKYFNNSISFNHNSYPSSKGIFSPQSIRGLPNDENISVSQYAQTPQMIPPSISSFNNHSSSLLKQGNTNSPSITANNNSNKVSPVSSNGNGTDVLPENFYLPEGVNYVCHYCDASFQVRGYLSRHIKKHAIVKEFTCPYYRYVSEIKSYMENNLNNSYYKTEENLEDDRKKYQSRNRVCHNHNGEFWRKDTLMIHLKKKHYSVDRNTLKLLLEQKKLEQGPGIKGKPKVDTTKLPGTCICCNERFANADDFCNNHVLAGSCSALPNGYSLKTNLDDEEKRKGNNKCVLKLIKFSNNDARFIFTKSAVVEPEVFSNREVIDLIVDMAERKTPMSNMNTPVFGDSNKLTSVGSGTSGNILSPQSSSNKLSPIQQQSLGIRQGLNDISTSEGSNIDGPLTHQSVNDTPIVEKLVDNRIVIHPDQVIPIDANTKRKRRRSKKEMKEYREKLAREKLEKEKIEQEKIEKENFKRFINRNSPDLQPLMFNGNAPSMDRISQPLVDASRMDLSNLVNSNNPSQLQLIIQIYQQQNLLLQQQQNQQMQANNNSPMYSNRMVKDYVRNADDDYQALDDDHYTGNGDEYSPSNKSTTTTNVSPPNMMNEQRRSESNGSQNTYANKALNTGYNMGLQQKYTVGNSRDIKVESDDYDEEGLSMDGGF